MADAVLFNNVNLWWGGYALEGDANNVGFTLKNAEKPSAQFGDTLDSTYPGLLAPEVNASGLYRADTGSPDSVLGTRLTTPLRTSWPLTMNPPMAPAATPGTAGNLSYTVTGAEFAYTIGGAHGDLLPYSIKKLPRSGGRVVRGTVVLPKASVAATTTGSAFELGALSSSQIMVAVFHMFSVTGGSWVLTIESDIAGFATPTTRATFTAATGITYQVVEIAGPVTDTFWRAVLTKTGGTSCIPAVTLGIIATP